MRIEARREQGASDLGMEGVAAARELHIIRRSSTSL
jgi:hypothetical protein